MPRYRVEFQCLSFSYYEIDVEADSPADAENEAMGRRIDWTYIGDGDSTFDPNLQQIDEIDEDGETIANDVGGQ